MTTRDSIDVNRLRQRRQFAKAFLDRHSIDPDDLQTQFWRVRFEDACPVFCIEHGSSDA